MSAPSANGGKRPRTGGSPHETAMLLAELQRRFPNVPYNSTAYANAFGKSPSSWKYWMNGKHVMGDLIMRDVRLLADALDAARKPQACAAEAPAPMRSEPTTRARETAQPETRAYVVKIPTAKAALLETVVDGLGGEHMALDF